MNHRKKLMFVGDRLMTTIVPHRRHRETDLGMLKCYMNSLGELKHKYKDCSFSALSLWRDQEC